jgi:type I restriction enzyme S subunit
VASPAADAFRSTEIGDFPTSWQLRTVGDLFELQQGKALSPEARRGINPRPFLRTVNVLWGRINTTTLDQMDFSGDEMKRLSLRPRDLLVCEGGEIGRTAVWTFEISDCFFQNHLHRLRRKTDEIEPEFVMYWMQAAFLRLGLYGGVGNKTTIPNLSGSRLKQLPVPAPPVWEQRAIAGVLSKLQARVELQGRVVATLKELKAATMAKLFREGLRGEPLKLTEIGEIPGSWDLVSLEDVCTRINYGTSVRCGADPVGFPVIRIPNVINERIDSGELKFADLTEREAGRYELCVGDLLFVRTNGNRNFIGRSAVYEGRPDRALFASYLIRVRLDDQKVLPEFAQAFLASSGRIQITSQASPASDGKFNIDTGVLKSVLLPRPSLDEQHAVVKALKVIDGRLGIEQRTLESMKDLFLTALDVLMTGRLRVVGASNPERPSVG